MSVQYFVFTLDTTLVCHSIGMFTIACIKFYHQRPAVSYLFVSVAALNVLFILSLVFDNFVLQLRAIS